jgi:hypothetical protein
VTPLRKMMLEELQAWCCRTGSYAVLHRSKRKRSCDLPGMLPSSQMEKPLRSSRRTAVGPPPGSALCAQRRRSRPSLRQRLGHPRVDVPTAQTSRAGSASAAVRGPSRSCSGPLLCSSRSRSKIRLARVRLLLAPCLVFFQDLVDGSDPGVQLGPARWLLPPVAGWHCITQHLPYCLASQTELPAASGSLILSTTTLAEPRIQLHCVHLSRVPQNTTLWKCSMEPVSQRSTFFASKLRSRGVYWSILHSARTDALFPVVCSPAP